MLDPLQFACQLFVLHLFHLNCFGWVWLRLHVVWVRFINIYMKPINIKGIHPFVAVFPHYDQFADQ